VTFTKVDALFPLSSSAVPVGGGRLPKFSVERRPTVPLKLETRAPMLRSKSVDDGDWRSRVPGRGDSKGAYMAILRRSFLMVQTSRFGDSIEMCEIIYR
jgi:hypothetical protein